MCSTHVLKSLVGVLLLVGWYNAGSANAQSVCAGPPFLGTTGPELCVHIEETNPAGASMDFRGPSPLVIPPLTPVGAYTIDSLTVTLTITPLGMAVTMNGSVTRTGAGTGGLSVIADGGLAPTPFEDADGDLILDGAATGMSQTQLGGGAGYAVAGTGDLSYEGFPRTIEESTFGSQAFGDEIYNQPIRAGAVAVHNHTHFHLNDVGASILIPSTVGIGDWRVGEPPPPPPPPPPYYLIWLLLVLLLALGGFLWFRRRNFKHEGRSQ